MTVCCGRGIWASGTWNCSILCLWWDVCTHVHVCAHMFMCVHLGLWACECLWTLSIAFHHVSVLWFEIGSFTLNRCSSSLVNLVCIRLTKKNLTGHLLSLKLPDWTGVTYVHPVCLFVWFLNVNAEEILVWGALHCLKHLPSPASSLLKGVWRCLLWGRKCLVSQSYDNQSSTPPPLFCTKLFSCLPPQLLAS